MKTIRISKYGIEITVHENVLGVISSGLKEAMCGSDFDASDLEMHGAIHAIESLLLAHACAGVDILSNEYRMGLDNAIEAISNNL